MKTGLISGALLVLAATTAGGQVYHQGYFRQDGTYVAPHYQTAPNSTKLDNYSTQGNYNPYTGKPGTVNPYAPPSPPRPYYPSLRR